MKPAEKVSKWRRRCDECQQLMGKMAVPTKPDLKIRRSNITKIRLVRANLLGLINRQDHNCAVIGLPLLRASPGCLAVR